MFRSKILMSGVVLFSLGCGSTMTTTDAGTTADAGAKTMFEKYGAAGFTAVNDKIIAKALAAPTASVGTSFQGLSDPQKTTLKNNLAAFLVQAYGGPANYTGKSMTAAHTGLNITEAQYDYFITEVVVPALSESGVTMDDITNGFAPAVTEKKAGSVKCATVQSGTKPTGCP
jgi:truncated hemoglobin YjbI